MIGAKRRSRVPRPSTPAVLFLRGVFRPAARGEQRAVGAVRAGARQWFAIPREPHAPPELLARPALHAGENAAHEIVENPAHVLLQWQRVCSCREVLR